MSGVARPGEEAGVDEAALHLGHRAQRHKRVEMAVHANHVSACARTALITVITVGNL